MAKLETIDDLKKEITALQEEGKKLISHTQRILTEYEDWQTRVWELEKVITKAEEDTGITKEEIKEALEEESFELKYE